MFLTKIETPFKLSYSHILIILIFYFPEHEIIQSFSGKQYPISNFCLVALMKIEISGLQWVVN